MYPNLKAEMARKGFTLADVSKVLGVRVSTVSDKFNGKYPISLNEAKKIKKMLDVDLTLEELFEEAS